MVRAAIIAAVCFASYAYFYEGGGWNQNTRFDLIRAIVERHTLQIDAYHDNTGDEAEIDGHFYADKAPGASLLAVPAVAAVSGTLRLAGQDVTSEPIITALSYVATVTAAAAPSAVAIWCVFLVARRLGAGETAAAFAALATGLGTPVWAYATILYGHALAAGGLMAAFLGTLVLADADTPSRQFRVGFWTGLAAGWTVITEFPAAIPAGLLIAFALARTGLDDRARFRRVLLALGLGLAFPAATLIAYNLIAFGAPVHVAYTNEPGFEGMRTGIFGISLPKISVMRELLLGDLRGLVPLAPIVLAAPVGFVLLIANRATRAPALVAAAIAVYFFLMTAGYAYWEGGWSYGSRHLGPGLPFLCIGLAPVWSRSRTPLRGLLLVLAFLGAGQALIAVATTPQPPIQYRRPMQELLWPAFKSGDFPIGWQSVLQKKPPEGPMSELERDGVPRASWNVGQLMGLGGHASLIPLGILWGLGGLLWWRDGTRRPAPDTGQATATMA